MSQIIVGVCREDNPRDVDEAYGEGTYARLFPMCEGCDDIPVKTAGDFCPECQADIDRDSRQEDPKHTAGRPADANTFNS